MKDRFKLRVWDKYEKSYWLQSTIEQNIHWLMNPEEYKDANYPPDYVEIEQCTGLKDKNSKLIYEGDILSLYKLKNPIVVICKWNIDKWVFVDTSGCIRNDYHMEVIGNIHENTDLLENEE